MELYSQIQEFWNNRPCNIKHSDKPFLSKEYFDEVEKKKYFVEPHIPKFAEFDKWKGKKVLEIGCGIGTDSINFARAGAHLTVVEFSEKSLNICKERFKVYNLNARFYLGNAENLINFLPFDTYDLIYSFGVIHHTPRPEKVFEQITYYMSNNTELRVMLYSKISWKLFWILLEQNKSNKDDINLNNLESIVKNNAEAQYGCPVAYTYTFEEIQNMISPFKLVINNIWKDHIFMYDIEKYKNHEYVLDKYWTGVSQEWKDIFCQQLGWHTLFIAKLQSD